jgi:hypothetical protein
LKFILLFLSLVMEISQPALAQLRAGDVAVIAYNTDTPDSFAWVSLCDIPPNTPIHFTNSSVSNGWFRWGDHLGRRVGPGPLSWISTNSLSAGSVVSWIAGTQKCWSVGSLSGGAMVFSAEGDQIFAYTGTIVSNAAGVSPWIGDATNAVVLFGLNFANKGWDNVSGGGNTSYIPPGLSVSAHTAVHAGNWDNGYYSGIRTGKVSELLTSIASLSNWNSSADFINPSQWPSFWFIKKSWTLIYVE